MLTHLRILIKYNKAASFMYVHYVMFGCHIDSSRILVEHLANAFRNLLFIWYCGLTSTFGYLLLTDSSLSFCNLLLCGVSQYVSWTSYLSVIIASILLSQIDISMFAFIFLTLHRHIYSHCLVIRAPKKTWRRFPSHQNMDFPLETQMQMNILVQETGGRASKLAMKRQSCI